MLEYFLDSETLEGESLKIPDCKFGRRDARSFMENIGFGDSRTQTFARLFSNAMERPK